MSTKRLLTALALSTTVAISALFAQPNQRTAPAGQAFPSYPLAPPTPSRSQPPAPAAAPAPEPETRSPAPVVRSEPTLTISESTRTASAGPRPFDSVVIGSRFDSNLYTVEKTLLSSTQLGENYQYRLRVTALENITKIHVVEHLPEGLEFIAASPDSSLDGRDLSWKYAALAKGESLDHLITVKPLHEGNFLTSSMVCVDPIVTLALFAGSPRLEITETGPATAEVGGVAWFAITVRNAGSSPARDVVVTYSLPAGLRYASAERQLVVSLGTLDAGESKVISIPLTVNSRGTHANTARATALGLQPVEVSVKISVVVN